ncbi:MAG: sodium/solute symporter [Verrucomicrobiota bacterium]|nr:sodium/solute symporter [Verrucomicrobiota bacterium]
METSGSLLSTIDFVIFFGSLLAIMAVGLWVGRREESSKDYFLAGRNARWWGVAGSIFGSNVSANHMVGMMGVGFAVGFAQSHFEITAIAGLLMLCYLLLPVYRKLNIYTLSEYLSRRYDDRSRVAYSVIMISIIVFVMTVPAFYIGSRSINYLLQGDTGQAAVAVAKVENSAVQAVVIANAGRGYAESPTVAVAAPVQSDGTAAVAKAILGEGVIAAVKVKAMGSGYGTNAPPAVTLTKGEAALQAVVKEGKVVGIEIVDGGSGFEVAQAPEIVIAPPASGTAATAYAAVVQKGIRRIELVNGGSGYETPPMVAITGGSAKAGLSPGDIDPLYYILGILGMALITGTYTVIGGLRAVIVTDVIQSILMLIGGLLLAYFMFTEIGGWSAMVAADASQNGGLERLHLYNPANHPALPWSGVITGLMVLHFYYWGANQFIVQRALAAKSDKEARTGIITAGFLKLLIPFFSVGCGIAAWYYYSNRAQIVAQDAVFMQLLGDLVQPVGYGLVGLVAAGVFGAILSSIDSMLNSGATLVTFDLYKRYVNPGADDKKLIKVGRFWVLFFLLMAAFVTILTADPNSKDSFFLQIANHQSKLIAGVVVAFFLGLLWKGATATGGIVAIVSGVLFSYSIPWLYPMVAGEGLTRVFGEELNFMHSVFVAAILSLILHIVVSRLTRNPDAEQNQAGHTWIGLGIFSRASFNNFAAKLCATLVVFAVFGLLMWRGFASPLVAALITATWTWLMFLDATLKTLLSPATKGRAHSLLREDKFWGGLLAACAVFMLFYFK